VICRIFESHATGRYGLRELAAELTRTGVKVPSIRGKWKGDTIAQIRGNVAHIGKPYTEKRRRQQGNLIDGTWPAIIDQALWDAVQRQLKLRAGGAPSHQRTG